MRKHIRSTGAAASLAGLMLAAGAAAPGPAGAAGAAEESSQAEINRGAVVYHATYVGPMDGVRGNTHDVSLESEGDMNYIQSYYCPDDANQQTKEGCTLRSDRRIAIDKSEVNFWVSSTGLSATITGTVTASHNQAWTTHQLDVTLYATADHDGDRDIYRNHGHVSGNTLGLDPGGFLTVD